MRKLVEYLRSCFCCHDFELIKEVKVYSNDEYPLRYAIGTKWVYRCKKCGYHKIEKDY